MSERNYQKQCYLLPLHVAVYQEGEYWIGHCKELDITNSSLNEVEAAEGIRTIVQAQIYFAVESGLQMNLMRVPKEPSDE